MKLYRLHTIQRLPLSIEAAWTFFSRPENLPLITPSWLGFQMTNASDLPEVIATGTLITYTIRPLLGIQVRWVTEITHADPPRRFVDEQRFGPYRFWHHQHHFRAEADGVVVEDLVRYALPLGTLGRLVHGAVVRPRLEAIFAFRRQALAERFGLSAAAPP